jgi:putative transposase
VDEEIKKGASFQSEKRNKAASLEDAKKERMQPVPENKVVSLEERAKDEQKPFLEQLLREGARKLLQAAIENEVLEYIQFHKDRLDENGQRLVVRNGHRPEREVISGVGPIPVRQPRVRHWDQGRFYQCDSAQVYAPGSQRRCFDSSPLPQGDLERRFQRSIDGHSGRRSQWLSATNIVRLKSGWETEYKAWNQRDLSTKRYVYWWVTVSISTSDSTKSEPVYWS